MEIITKSANETYEFGKSLAKHFRDGDVLLLIGELGAGKTTLIKGIAAGFGIEQDVTSPTFSLINHYKVQNNKIKNIIHIDTYRINDPKELEEIGIDEFLGQANSLCIVEWPEKIQSILIDKTTTAIAIEHLSENKRLIKMS